MYNTVMNQISKDWKDYEVIDTGNKEKLERWNKTILRRPDPVCIWPIEDESKWNNVDAIYHRSKSEEATGKQNTQSKNFGQSVIKNCALKLVQLVLNILDYSLNKLRTGIL